VKNIFFLFIFFQGWLFAQTNGDGLVLKKKLYSDKTLSDSGKATIYNRLTEIYFQLNRDSAKHFNYIAEVLSLKTKDKRNYAAVLYYKAAFKYFDSQYDSTINLLNKSILNLKGIKYQFIESKQYNLYGAVEFLKGNYKLAEEYYLKNLNINIETGDTASILNTYYNISLIHNSQGDYSKAIEYNYKILEIADKVNDSTNLMLAYQGLGIAYGNVSEVNNSLLYLKKAYQIALRKKLEYEQIGILIDLGNNYKQVRNYTMALYYENRAIALATKISDQRTLSVSLSNKAATLLKMGKSLEAEDLLNQSILISKKIDFTNGTLESYITLSQIYFLRNDFEKSKYFAYSVLAISKLTGGIDDEKNAYRSLYSIYKKQNKNDSSLFYFEKYTHLKDSFINESKFKEIAVDEFKYQKQKEDEIKKLEKELYIKELDKQKVIRTAITIASIILLVFLVIVFRNYREKQKANQEIQKQKQVIESKNKDILDSINYAKRIQYGMLAQDPLLKANLNEFSILFKPKDIVSGDFYWAYETKEKFYLCVADSTGHGVPGAFMCLLNIGFLNEAINEKKLYQPHEIFNHVRQRLIENISKDGQKDGFDGTLICFDKKNSTITYAAAHNPPFVISGNSITECKYDKMPVGQGEQKESFNLYELPAKKGDVLYLLTDGYADQFGGKGEQGKKFKKKNLKDLLAKIQDKKLNDQIITIEKTFNEWKGDLEQVDDVCIIGLRI